MSKRPKDDDKIYTDPEEILRILRELDSDDECDEVDNLSICNSDSDDSDEDPTFDPTDNNFNNSDDEMGDDEVIIRHIKEIETPTSHPTTTRKQFKAKNNKATGNMAIQNSSIIIKPSVDELKGKDGKYTWKTDSFSNTSKIPAKNIIHVRPGPTKIPDPDPITCFRLYFTDEIINNVLNWTNDEINRQRIKYKNDHSSNLNLLTKEELEAYFGILLMSSAMNDNHLTTDILFSKKYSGDKYISIMSRVRFNFITNCLKFDDISTREERRQLSKLAPIEDIWNLFIHECRVNYKPSSYCTIDEQLVGFRGRCPFRVYMGSKPNKYGIKILMICDNSTKYMFDALPYLGKGSNPDGEDNFTNFSVRTLVKSIKGSNRNVTMDNWFVSVPLIEEMLSAYKLTTVGTIRKNKRELPEEFVNLGYNKRGIGSSFFLFSEKIAAVSYKPKSNKLVCLVSTMHNEVSVREVSNKPEIIHTYNQTKGAVDTFDQMCQKMNAGRKTRRWPLCYFYNMLNMASINSFVVYTHQYYKYGGAKSLSRMQFVIQLSEQLSLPWKKLRLENPKISKTLKETIKNSFETETRTQKQIQPDDIHPEKFGKRTYCYFCPYNLHKMTKSYCQKCQQPICGSHAFKSCSECLNGKKADSD